MTAREIADSLSKEQKKSIVKAKHDGQLWLVDAPWEMSDEFHALGITGQDGWTDALTPLGQQVRKILENPNGK